MENTDDDEYVKCGNVLYEVRPGDHKWGSDPMDRVLECAFVDEHNDWFMYDPRHKKQFGIWQLWNIGSVNMTYQQACYFTEQLQESSLKVKEPTPKKTSPHTP